MNSKERLSELFKFYFQVDELYTSDIQAAIGDIDTMVECIEDIAEQVVRKVLAKGLGFELSDEELRRKTHFLLMREAALLAGVGDDAGCDWFIDDEGKTYIAGKEWLVSTNPRVAQLVDVAYYILGLDARLPSNEDADENADEMCEDLSCGPACMQSQGGVDKIC